MSDKIAEELGSDLPNIDASQQESEDELSPSNLKEEMTMAFAKLESKFTMADNQLDGDEPQKKPMKRRAKTHLEEQWEGVHEYVRGWRPQMVENTFMRRYIWTLGIHRIAGFDKRWSHWKRAFSDEDYFNAERIGQTDQLKLIESVSTWQDAKRFCISGRTWRQIATLVRTKAFQEYPYFNRLFKTDLTETPESCHVLEKNLYRFLQLGRTYLV